MLRVMLKIIVIFLIFFILFYAYLTIMLQLQRGLIEKQNKTKQTNKQKNTVICQQELVLLMYHICSQSPGLVLCVRIPF